MDKGVRYGSSSGTVWEVVLISECANENVRACCTDMSTEFRSLQLREIASQKTPVVPVLGQEPVVTGGVCWLPTWLQFH